MKLTIEDLGAVIPKGHAEIAIAAMTRAAHRDGFALEDATVVECQKQDGRYVVSAMVNGSWYDWADYV
jgi:hypothetical protein